MFKRILFFAVLLVSLLGASASAADWGRLMTPKTPLNVRQQRTLSSPRVTTIMPGEEVRADFLEDGWYAVFRPNENDRNVAKALGFVNAGYLVPVGEWGELRSPRGMLNVRSKRAVDSEHVRTLSPDDVVKVDFEKDGWVAIFAPDEKVRSLKNAIGFSNDKYLYPATAEQIERVLGQRSAKSENAAPQESKTAEPVSAKEQSVASGPAPSEAAQSASTGQSSSSHWGRLVKVSRRVNLRAERTAASKLVKTLEPGQAVRVDFLRKGWFAAFNVGETRRDEKHALGFVYAALIEDDLGALPDLPTSRVEPLPPGMQDRIGASGAEREDAPLYQVRGKVSDAPPVEFQEEVSPESAKPERLSEQGGASTPPQLKPLKIEKNGDSPERVVVDPAKAPEQFKGPVPVADQTRHGFRYAVMERQEGREGRYPLDILRIYLDVSVVPESVALSDFCSTLWKEEWRQGTLLRVDVYLPGMDTKDLSYAEALFDGKGLRQFWTREAVLYGTRFKR